MYIFYPSRYAFSPLLDAADEEDEAMLNEAYGKISTSHPWKQYRYKLHFVNCKYSDGLLIRTRLFPVNTSG